MKQIFLTLIAILSLVACSKEETASSLSETSQTLVGTWNTSEDLTGNSYTYNEDGTARYINDLAGTFEGVWEIIDGNVLIEFYPDSDESYDNWQDNPDLRNRVEFTSGGYILETTDFNDNSSVTLKYRDGLIDGQKVATQPYLVEFTTGQLEEYVSVFATTTVYFANGTKSQIDSELDRDTDTLQVEIPEDVFRFETEFYIEDSSQVEMRFFGKNDDRVIHEETISQQQIFDYEYIF